MKTSDRAIELIKEFEGCRLESYRDVVGVWTVGYGHTRDARPDQRITQQQADIYLRDDLKQLEGAVSKAVSVPLNQNQFGALVCFAYNVGPEAFAQSTLLRLLNSGDYAGAAKQFKRWNKAGGRVFEGLVRRRSAERALFEESMPA